jgi:hypothetical protein
MVKPSAAFRMPRHVQLVEDQRTSDHTREPARQHISEDTEIHLLASQLHGNYQHLDGYAER